MGLVGWVLIEEEFEEIVVTIRLENFGCEIGWDVLGGVVLGNGNIYFLGVLRIDFKVFV